MRGFAKVTQDLSDRRHMQDLEQAAKNISEFIAVLAHELRNPLAPIRNAVEVMAKAPATDPAQHAMRATIERQTNQLGRILDDMLDISRITRGELEIQRSSVDLNDVVQNAVETAAPAVEAGKHRLDVQLSPTPLLLKGDLQRLTQLLANVLNNAARYTPPDGSITVSVHGSGGYGEVRVRDNGRGIDPGSMDRIFDMFVQARPPLQRIGAGLGIGLALARRIAELHGGSLTAASEGEGKGAEFMFRVPLVRMVAVPTKPAEKPTPAPQVVPRRILVVDDNVDAAKTLELLLKSLGHDTRAVFNGVEALRVATEFRPDVVLLDIGMPGLDGYEVARRLRHQNPQHTFKIIAVTGWGQESDRQKTREAGFDLHLVKPVDITALAKAVTGRNGATLH
jgi:CheY-like chemotaxis protein